RRIFFAQNRSRRVPGAALLAGTPGAGVSRRIRATQEFGFQVHRALFLGQAPSVVLDPDRAQIGDWLEFRRLCETSCLYPLCPTTNLTRRNLRRRLRATTLWPAVHFGAGQINS